MLGSQGSKQFSRQRSAFLVLKLMSLVCALALLTVLTWLRLDWGVVTDWVHHATFTHFWSGVYILLAAFTILTADSILAACAIRRYIILCSIRRHLL